MRKPVTPFGYALFCDDIRQEVGNKVSLMGLYTGVAVFESEFPITIPRLCIAVHFVQDREDEVKPVKLKVISTNDDGEQLILEGDLDMQVERIPVAPGATRMTTAAHIVLSPLTIEKPGAIRVRAYYGEEEYKLGGLQIVTAPWPPAD